MIKSSAYPLLNCHPKFNLSRKQLNLRDVFCSNFSTHLLSLESLLTVTESIEKNSTKNGVAVDEKEFKANPVPVIHGVGVTLKGSGHLAGKSALHEDDHREDEEKNVRDLFLAMV